MRDIQPTQGNHFYELIKTALIAALIALTVRSLAFEPFSIPSSSMVPNLLVGDYLFVSKYSYGYSQYSFPLAMFKFPGRLYGEVPKRGDVIVFRNPHQTNVDYIKRLIGLPGDKIQMRAGRLFINGQKIKREFVGEQVYQITPDISTNHKRYRETLPNGVQHLIIERSDNGPLDNTQVFTVPEGHYFMMGDNRDGSQDSRVQSEVGYVPFENLVGRAERVFLSIGDNAQAWEIWRWPTALRYDRFFTEIK